MTSVGNTPNFLRLLSLSLSLSFFCLLMYLQVGLRFGDDICRCFVISRFEFTLFPPAAKKMPMTSELEKARERRVMDSL